MAAPVGFTESGLTLLEGINWISRDSQGLTLQWSGSRRSLTCGFREGTATTPCREAVGKAKRIGALQRALSLLWRFSFGWILKYALLSSRIDLKRRGQGQCRFGNDSEQRPSFKGDHRILQCMRLVTFYVTWWIVWRHVVCKVLFILLM